MCVCVRACMCALCEGMFFNETCSLFQILQLHQRSHHAPEPPATWAALPASAAPGTATTRASRWARSWLCSGLWRMSMRCGWGRGGTPWAAAQGGSKPRRVRNTLYRDPSRFSGTDPTQGLAQLLTVPARLLWPGRGWLLVLKTDSIRAQARPAGPSPSPPCGSVERPLFPRQNGLWKQLALRGAAWTGTRGSGAGAQELLRGSKPSLPAARPGREQGPGVLGSRDLGGALLCGAM